MGFYCSSACFINSAKEWKDQIWVGKAQVVTQGDSCAVKLIGHDGKVFAVAPIRREGPTALEPVADSSRYFVLRIEDSRGQHAFIGMGFRQRSHAFDLNVALQEFQEEVEGGDETKKIDFGPEEDFSLKEGQKIRVSGKLANRRRERRRQDGDGGGLALPPPPGGRGGAASGGLRRPGARSTQGDGEDLLGLGAPAPAPAPTSAPAPTPAPAPTSAPAPAQSDDWEMF